MMKKKKSLNSNTEINIKIKIESKEINSIIKYIKKIIKVNNLHIQNNKFQIILDYSLKDCGEYIYWPEEHIYPKSITVNPKECANPPTISIGWSEDKSVFTTAIHEFCHYLGQKLGIYKRFLEDFKHKDKLILCENSGKDREEELAELLCVYFINPYFIYKLSEGHYDYVKQFLKSPATCSLKYFEKLYKKWDPLDKTEFERKYKEIIYK